VLKQAQARVLNLQHWHDFLKAILRAGFRSGRIISSKNNLLFAYILYLLGRTEYHVEEHKLRRLIAQWFFMTALTGRYTSSPESKMEFDLARLRGLNDAGSFVAVLEDICNATLTNDYWSITLPTDLATAAANSPSMFAFFAALNLHDARVLFRNKRSWSSWTRPLRLKFDSFDGACGREMADFCGFRGAWSENWPEM
jgi:hypothetical protein